MISRLSGKPAHSLCSLQRQCSWTHAWRPRRASPLGGVVPGKARLPVTWQLQWRDSWNQQIMASGRAPLAPRNVDYPRKPRSVIPEYSKDELVVSLRWFNDNCADSSALVEPKITSEDLVKPTVSSFLWNGKCIIGKEIQVGSQQWRSNFSFVVGAGVREHDPLGFGFLGGEYKSVVREFNYYR